MDGPPSPWRHSMVSDAEKRQFGARPATASRSGGGAGRAQSRYHRKQMSESMDTLGNQKRHDAVMASP